MKYIVILTDIIFISILYISILFRFTATTKLYVNDRPIIGILSQEMSFKFKKIYSTTGKSYIAASYVKFIESAGARVIPIWIGQPLSYYEKILNKINGVLFPGGAASFNTTNGYADAAWIIYRIAIKFNEEKDFFPIWGTCLGFEILTYIAANRYEHRILCSSNSQALSLEFSKDFKQSRLFNTISNDLFEILFKENVTWNHHRYCVTREGLIKANLMEVFRILSLNRDLKNREFVSIIEHIKMPFYGVQFHPEKNAFEWIKKIKIPHSSNAVKVGHYFAEFFVNEARKNNHSFLNSHEENAALIYNYPVTYTGIKGSSFIQSYIFTMNI